MNWRMRREGSPHETSGLTPAKVMEGLRDGVWELTDEVRGPTDAKWTPLEGHPHFAEALADYDPEPPKHADLEENLDMNPLIDVALVLLIFFILTTSYDALRRVMDMPKIGQKKQSSKPQVSQKELQSRYIHVQATRTGDKVTYMVDKQPVEESQLRTAIELGVSQGRTEVIIDTDNVTFGTFMYIYDVSRSANGVTGWKVNVAEARKQNP
jgi:biopolymer transport protein ExbD